MQAEAAHFKAERRRYLNAIPILIASIAFVSITWMGVMIEGDALIGELAKASSTIRALARDTATLVGIGFVLSMIGVGLSSALLVRRAHIFLAIWCLLLSISDARIPFVQQLSLAVRYPMMISLLLVGIYALWKNFGRLNLVQHTGLFVLAWCFLQLFINPVDTDAILLLPMQVAMFVGIICGLPILMADQQSARKLAYALAIAGIVNVCINYLSFIFMPRVFLAGRFTSWFALPTGFSNMFVLCITPLMWAMLDTRRFWLRILFLGFFLAALLLIILSGTRNAILALAIAAVILTFFWKRRFFIYVVIAGGLLLLGALALDVGLADLGQAGVRIGHVAEKEVRYTVWARAWSFIAENPVWGYGLSVGLQHLDKKSEAWDLFNAHNALLGIWLRIGVVGVIAYLLMYLRSFMAAFAVLARRKFPENEISVLVLFACLLSQLFIAGMFEENLSSRASVFQALWAISLTMIFLEARRLRQQQKLRQKLKRQALLNAVAPAQAQSPRSPGKAGTAGS